MAESCRKSLALRQKLGPDCGDTLRIASNLAGALEEDGSSDEAAALLHEIILKAQACCSAYMEQGNHVEAILAKERELYIRRWRLGPKDPETMRVRKALALLYEETGKYDKAEKAFEKLLETMEQKWGFYNQETLDLNEEFAQLLDKHGKPEKAAQRRRLSLGI